MQQLRDCRPRGHGLLRDHSQDCAGGRRRYHRAVGSHHPVAGRDGARGQGDGASGLQAAAADRRCHHLQGAHSGEDRTKLLGACGLCLQRLPRGGGGPEPAQPGSQGGVCRPHRQGVRDRPGSACPQAAALPPGQSGPCPRQPASAGLGWLPAAQAPRARGAEVRRCGHFGAAPLHRLDAVLPQLGAGGQVSAHPRGRDHWRGGDQAVCRRQRHAGPAGKGSERALRRGDRPVPGQRGRRQHRSLQRRVPHRGHQGAAPPAPAEREAGLPQLLSGGLCGAERERQARLDRRLRGDRRHR